MAKTGFSEAKLSWEN